MTGIKIPNAMKWASIFLFLGAVCVGLWAYLFPSQKPPEEESLLKAFYSNRTAYEHLRDMLLADEQVNEVYTRLGVETTSSGLPHPPTEVNFPPSRYNEYRILLEQVHSEQVFRRGDKNPEICISLWGAGFGGDTRHVDLCWLDHAPTNQTARLDDFYKTQKPRHPIFRHIDENWYLWADW